MPMQVERAQATLPDRELINLELIKLELYRFRIRVFRVHPRLIYSRLIQFQKLGSKPGAGAFVLVLEEYERIFPILRVNALEPFL